MQEPRGDRNYGRRASEDPQGDGARTLPLGVEETQAREFMQSNGWEIVETARGSGGIAAHGAGDAGMSAHRGVLQPDEYVDAVGLQTMVVDELGFTYEQVCSVYRQGPLSADQRELRGRIDARLLALSRAGGNMAELGRALGFPIKGDGHCRVFENALTRARAEDN